MSRNPAPLDQPIINEIGDLPPEWVLFFDGLFRGDSGNDWTPEFVGLTSSGTPTITGRYYQITSSLVYFRVTVTPATNTSSVAGTTYINNFPLSIFGSGACLAVAPTSGVGVGLGVADAGSGRVFTPAWTTATVPITIIGLLEAR